MNINKPINKIIFTNEELNEEFKYYVKNLEIEYSEENDYELKAQFIANSIWPNSAINKDADSNIDKWLFNKESYFNWIYFDDSNDKNNIYVVVYVDNNDDVLDKNFFEPYLSRYFNLVYKTMSYLQNNKQDSNPEEFEEKVEEILNEIASEIDFEDIYFHLVFISPNSNEYKTKYENICKEIIEEKNLITKSKGRKKIDSILFKSEEDILNLINKNKKKSHFIERDVLSIDKSNNYLEYTNLDPADQIDKAFVLNISAKSLRKLWKKYENNLLDLNLRYYVKNKNIDEKIKYSMNPKTSKLFWIKNNGLVIICKNIEFLNNNQIELLNFSIVNGGQTTFNIGNFAELDQDDLSDFYVLSKIICINQLENQEDHDFENISSVLNLANEIAEATNSQKPIKSDDLLVNLTEIKNMKKLLQNQNIYLGTRRGEKKIKLSSNDKWRFIHFSKIVQISASFYDLAPGTARNTKNKLFKEKNVKNVFGEYFKNDFSTWIELIKFFYILEDIDKAKSFKKIVEDYFEPNDDNIRYYNNFFKYCKFYSISILRVIKIFLVFGQEAINEYKMMFTTNEASEDKQIDKKLTEWSNKWWNQLSSENKRIFKVREINDLKEEWIKLCKNVFFNKWIKITSDIPSPTNFTKTNKNFYQVFVREFIWEFDQSKNFFNDFFYLEK